MLILNFMFSFKCSEADLGDLQPLNGVSRCLVLLLFIIIVEYRCLVNDEVPFAIPFSYLPIVDGI